MTMRTPAPTAHSDCIAAALDALCRRAQVALEDDSRSAGIAVAGVLQRDGMFLDTESDCPFASWLTQASGLDESPADNAPRVIVGNVNVFLRMPRTGITETIPMPLAVAAMVRVCLHKGSWRVPPLVGPRKRVRKPRGNSSAGEAA
jgi:hypothetical protein